MARYDEEKIKELLSNPGLIRNKLKMEAAPINAKLFLKVQKEFGSFDSYIWGFVNGKPIQNHCHSLKDIPADTNISKALSIDLKKRGFKFVGPTIIYAHMQAIGMVNDHTIDCFRHNLLIT